MWRQEKLKDICKVFADGNWIETKDQSEDGIRLVQTGNIKTGSFSDRIDKARFINENTFKRLNCTEIFEGDLLVSRLPDPVGRACIIPELKDRAITAVDCSIIRLKDIILPEFACYFMQSSAYFSEVQQRVTGATRQRISRKNLGEILFPIPPLAEQQRIVKKLDAAIAEIDCRLNKIQIQIYESNQIFGNFIDQIMEADTHVSTLGELSLSVTDGDHQPPPKSENGVPFVTISNVNKQTRQIDFSNTFFVPQSYYDNITETRRPQKGDILYTVTGSFGIPVLIETEKSFCFQRHIAIIRPKPDVYSKWLYYALRSSNSFRQADRAATGAAQRTVSLKSLRNLIVRVPSIEKQKSDVTKLQALEEKIEEFLEVKRKSFSCTLSLKSAILARELQRAAA